MNDELEGAGMDVAMELARRGASEGNDEITAVLTTIYKRVKEPDTSDRMLASAAREFMQSVIKSSYAKDVAQTIGPSSGLREKYRGRSGRDAQISALHDIAAKLQEERLSKSGTSP